MKYKGGLMHLRAEGREIEVEARHSCLEDGGWERLREPCVARAQQVMSVCCGSPALSCLESGDLRCRFWNQASTNQGLSLYGLGFRVRSWR